jgi:hypothetical protein
VRGSGDEQAAARVQKCPSPEDGLTVVVRRERFVYRIWGHVKAAARAVEKATHSEQSILRAISDEVERRVPSEDDRVVWASQPINTAPFVRNEKSQRVVDAQDGRNAREHVYIQREFLMLARLLAPVVIGGPRRIPEDQKALHFGQPPQICYRDKSPQRRAAEPPSVGRREPGALEPLRLTNCICRVRIAVTQCSLASLSDLYVVQAAPFAG